MFAIITIPCGYVRLAILCTNYTPQIVLLAILHNLREGNLQELHNANRPVVGACHPQTPRKRFHNYSRRL